PIDRFDSDFGGIHAALASRVASFTLRRREFLNWRYFGSPTRTYHVALVERWGQPQGYVAFRLVDRIAHVVDLFLSPDPRLAERTLALDSVSFDVDAGQIVGLIGPNGAGKTTLFNCLSRLSPPDGGDVRFDGRPILGLPAHRIAELGIGRTFQNLALFPTLTVLQNV